MTPQTIVITGASSGIGAAGGGGGPPIAVPWFWQPGTRAGWQMWRASVFHAVQT